MNSPSLAFRPYIVEDDNFLSLQFSNWGVQTRMRKSAPHALVLSYTEAMMAFLLLQPAPQDILIVGLGGGSMSKFCYQHLPSSCITTVEVNADVIALRQTFHIPEDNARFRVIHDDAAHYLANQHGIADVILLDGYDNFGIPPALSSSFFYRHCFHALRKSGVLAANISSSVGAAVACASRIRNTFEGRAATIQARSGYNDIVFGLKEVELPDQQVLRNQAAALWRKTGVNFPVFVDQMIGSLETTGQALMASRGEECGNLLEERQIASLPGTA